MFDQSFFTDPYPLYRQLRGGRPIQFLPGVGKSGGWLVPGYDNAVSVLNDVSLTSARSGISFMPFPPDERTQLQRIQAIFAQSMMFLDPPDHTRWRRVMLKAFTRARIDELWPVTRSLAQQLLKAADDKGSFDFVADYANLLPIYVVAHLLGAEIDDHKQFAQWARDISTFVSTVQPSFGMAERAQVATLHLFTHLKNVIAARLLSPKHDAISEMVRELQELNLDPAQQEAALAESLPAHCVGLLVAGHETSSNLIGNALHALFTHPDALRSIVADPASSHAATDEFARYDSSVQILVRLTKTPVSLLGQAVGAGQVVMALVGSANRDEAKFSQPDLLDLSRRGERSLTFGSGRHYCPGTQMGLMEVGIALEELFLRFPRVAPAVPIESVQWRPSVNFRGLSSLSLRTH